ncbi:hypothetical protein TNIN_442651 [Trichonephila inaurata madagascariensis]|uniref:Uncharacterized protein n=1 Tax=Trichonephila inaurata madagascariensis TaxID=2747483 RepID=A0A8X7BVF6_9ARAC|nr:hypothetical protein TNIN_442651 [Trichonephila inaurata madagascariensis]
MLKMGAAFAECRSEANAQTIFVVMFGPIQLGYTTDFLQQFVTVDETWIHHHTPPSRFSLPGRNTDVEETLGQVLPGRNTDVGETLNQVCYVKEGFHFLKERMSENEQAGGRDGRRPSPSRNRRRNERRQQRSTLTVSVNRERIAVPQNRAVNISNPDNVMSRAAGDRNIVNPSRLLARPALPPPIVGAAHPINLPAPVIRPAGAAHPDNLPPPIPPAGVQVPPAQRARYLCVVCRRFFNVIVPNGPRVCPNCRQNEGDGLNPMVEREQRQQLFRHFFR